MTEHKMFPFIERWFYAGLAFSSTLTSINSLSCISMNNEKYRVRPQIVSVNSKKPVFSPFSIKASKGSGSCNNINEPYPKSCVPYTAKNLNLKVFQLMSKTNQTRHRME